MRSIRIFRTRNLHFRFPKKESSKFSLSFGVKGAPKRGNAQNLNF